MKIQKQLGMRVRYLRKKLNLSIEDLALQCGVNRNYLGDLERGKRNPTLEILSRLSIGLGISLQELFKGLEVY